MTGPDSLGALLDALADDIATRVADKLRAAADPELVDQRSSPLGSRRHCAAIRSGELAGCQIGRRWVARKADVEAYLAERSRRQRKPRTKQSDLAAELGLRLVSGGEK